MDYKAIIEEQIKALEKVQDSILKANQPLNAEAACTVANTIERLCITAHRWPTISKG